MNSLLPSIELQNWDSMVDGRFSEAVFAQLRPANAVYTGASVLSLTTITAGTEAPERLAKLLPTAANTPELCFPPTWSTFGCEAKYLLQSTLFSSSNVLRCSSDCSQTNGKLRSGSNKCHLGSIMGISLSQSVVPFGHQTDLQRFLNLRVYCVWDMKPKWSITSLAPRVK